MSISGLERGASSLGCIMIEGFPRLRHVTKPLSTFESSPNGIGRGDRVQVCCGNLANVVRKLVTVGSKPRRIHDPMFGPVANEIHLSVFGSRSRPSNQLVFVNRRRSGGRGRSRRFLIGGCGSGATTASPHAKQHGNDCFEHAISMPLIAGVFQSSYPGAWDSKSKPLKPPL